LESKSSASEHELLGKLRDYFATTSHPIGLAYLFGSRAVDKATSLSDIDVAVYIEGDGGRPARLELYLPLLAELRGLVGNVDLIYLNDASPLLGHRIIRDGRLLYAASEAQRVTVETQVLQRYLDHIDFHAIRRRYLRKRVLDGRMGEGGADMIDRRVIEERLDYIQVTLGLLKEDAKLDLATLRADPRRVNSLLYSLQTCLEAITDIASHLVAALNLRKPEDRGELMTILAEAEIIPQALAASLIQAIGMRNVIVHGYLHVASELVHRSLRENLRDIEEFCQCIMRYLEKEV